MSYYRDIEGKVSIDVETTGLDWNRDKPFSFAVADAQGSMYYDLREDPNATWWLNEQLKRGGVIKVVNHNIKFDIHMLRQVKVNLDPKICECTQIRAALIDEHLQHYSLDSLAKKYLDVRKDTDIYAELAEIFGGLATKNVQVKNFPQAPVDLMARYAKTDVEVALALYDWQEKEIEKQNLSKIWNFEKRLFPHIVGMEKHGIRIDSAKAEQQMVNLTKEVDLLQKYLNSNAGFEVNTNPSGSLHTLFEPKQGTDGKWVANDGTVLDSTDKGKASLSADNLKRMRHPLARTVLKIRKYSKTRDTFIRNHIVGQTFNSRVYPIINQTRGENGGTITGRFSYAQPPLQQIPARDKEIAELVRPIFLPDENQYWTYGDMDQFEFRMFSHYVNNPKIIDEYQNNPDLDFHQKIADLTDLPRSAPSEGGPSAKQVNLAMIYGMGNGQLAHDLNLPWTEDTFLSRETGEEITYKKAGIEVLDLVDRYHGIVPGVKELSNQAKNIAKRRGYVLSIMGRHIRFPNSYEARKAAVLLCQGSSADINKLNIINICEYLDSECPEGHLLLNIHDEYSLSLPGGRKDPVTTHHLKEVKRLLEDRKSLLRVPVRIDFSELSINWWEATKAKKVT